ncbi:MAG: redoxin domain-containing protein [Gammaproteobacteria bacterium]
MLARIPRPLRYLLMGAFVLLTVLTLLPTPPGLSPTARASSPPSVAPPFTQTSPEAWINSGPLTWDDLRGQVVLLDVWTFDCWNCYRSFPWLNSLEARYGDKGLTVIGIHTPEFRHEHKRPNVEQKVHEFELHHPIMMDNDFGYWNALNNRYWPAFYLVDKQGRIRGRFIGETHAGDRNASAIETQVRELLAE